MSFPFSLCLLLQVLEDGSTILVGTTHQNGFIHIEDFGAFMHIGGANDFIWDDSDALHNVLGELSTLDGVTLCVFQQEISFEKNKVCLMGIHIFLELLCIMLTGKTIRVIPIRQKQYLHVHAFSKEHVCAACGSMNARFITIVKEGDVVGEAVKEMNLCLIESGTRVRHHILNATLVHGKHIRVALNHIHHILFGYLLLGLENAIEFVGFMIDDGIRRIDVLLIHALGTGIQHTTTERDHLTIDSHPREHRTSTETVIEGAIITLHTQTCIHQIFFIIPLCLRLLQHRIRTVQTETETELGNDVVTETTTTEISQTDGTTILIIHHGLTEILGSPFVDSKHTLTLIHLLTLLVSHLLFLNRNAVFLCQMFQRLHIAHLFHLHDEVDRVATLAATEALAHSTRRGDRKRGGFIVVERTQSLVACACAAKRDVIRNDINNVGGVNDSVDGGLWYHKGEELGIRS